jgi:hypothetical protein
MSRPPARVLLLAAAVVLSSRELEGQGPRTDADGPHVLWNGPDAEVLGSRGGRITRAPLPAPWRLEVEGLPALLLSPRGPGPAEATLGLPGRVCVLSDLHGNWEGTVSLLEAHGIVDRELRWSWGRGHLVVVGDVVDRGDGQTELLWLLRSLESQAEEAGGRVHVLLGNHETMLMRGDERYLSPADCSAWAGLEGGVRTLFGPRSEIGRWLRTRSAVLRLGDVLFVHGGLSPALLERFSNPESLNVAVRAALDEPGRPFLLGPDGPFWYRGLVPGEETKRPDATTEDVDRALRAFRARRVVVGHSTLPGITAFHGGRVLAVDAGLKDGNPGEILLLENGRAFRGFATGGRQPLE